MLQKVLFRDRKWFGTVWIIGIKLGFPYINICQVQREVLKNRGRRLRLLTLPEGPANVNALESHVWSLLLHRNTVRCSKTRSFEENEPINLFFLWLKARLNGTFSVCILKMPLPGQILTSCMTSRFYACYHARYWCWGHFLGWPWNANS